MKRVLWLTVFLLVINIVSAEENLYLLDKLDLRLGIDSNFELVPKSNKAQIKEVSVDLLLFPQDSYQQRIINLDTKGLVKDDRVKFFWDDGKISGKEFGYSALIETINKRIKVKHKILFPITDVEGMEDFLKATSIIDSDNPAIIAKAAELAEGEDDLFKVVFNLAGWVEENVVYDLNTLTATASQKASWVLSNKQGVCDEMTSLFIAMARSLGIPARFASGISYTTSELFDENWQSHGWAEIYFPALGWVSFDVTFGEFGYVDVTHIKLREGFDPASPAVEYQWTATDVDLKKGPLDLTVNLENKGTKIPDEVFLDQETLAEEIDFGSYNLIKGVVKNNEDYYTAAALTLAVPLEIKVEGRNRRNVMLSPNEIRETYWVVKVPDNLDKNYIYSFPFSIYSEKNVSIQGIFKSQQGLQYYSQKDILDLSIEDEEKVYSRKLSFKCDYLSEIKLGEDNEIKCTIKNSGNTNLKEINICLDDFCEVVNLPINQVKIIESRMKGEEVGWKKIILSAENDLVEKKELLSYAVLDNPVVTAEASYPQIAAYGEIVQIDLKMKRVSFSEPKDVVVRIIGPNFESKWEVGPLEKDTDLVLELEGTKLTYTNEFKLEVNWKDQDGKQFSEEQAITIKAKASSMSERIKMFFNWLLGILN
ncbi:MAG: transglutaminase-like domain-containing protein [Nanoarchaeota archaeon]|nr:transglutaminase-like domain-containing protein [Nanoarchaeota archaeon]MBU1976989.1 transglutaminase-like domain-containing protein [Nanoarchaeota archaeon]